MTSLKPLLRVQCASFYIKQPKLSACMSYLSKLLVLDVQLSVLNMRVHFLKRCPAPERHQQ